MTGLNLDIWGMGVEHFFRKSLFCLLAAPKQTSFLIISNENILFKTQGTVLCAIVTANEGL